MFVTGTVCGLRDLPKAAPVGTLYKRRGVRGDGKERDLHK